MADIVETIRGRATKITQIGGEVAEILAARDEALAAINALIPSGADDTESLNGVFEAGGTIVFYPWNTYLISELLTIPDDIIATGTLRLRYVGPNDIKILGIGANVELENLIIEVPTATGISASIGRNYHGTSIICLNDVGSQAGFISMDPRGLQLERFESVNFARPLTLDHEDGVSWAWGGRIGYFRAQGYIRALKLVRVDGLRVDRYDIYERYPTAAFEPGHNAILIEGGRNLVFGEGRADDAAEHLLRYGGAYLSYNNRHGNIKGRNTGGTLVKINTSPDPDYPGVKPYGFYFDDIEGIGTFDDTPGGNREGIRASHCREVHVGRLILTKAEDAERSANDAIALNDVDGFSCGHVHVDDLHQQILHCNKDQDVSGEPDDWTAGDVANVVLGKVTGDHTNNGQGFRFAMAGYAGREIHVSGMDVLLATNLLAATSGTTFEGQLVFDGRVRKTDMSVPPTTTNLPADAIINLQFGSRRLINQGGALVFEDTNYPYVPEFFSGTDAEKLQAAIDAAYDAGGGAVRVSKQLLIDETILLYPGVSISGTKGMGGIKRADASGVFDLFTLGAEGDGFGLYDLEIDGNRDGQAAVDENSAVISLNSGSTSGVGGNEPNSNRFEMIGCRIFNWSYEGQGVNVLGFRGLRIDDCEFEDGGSDLWHAIYARRIADFQVTNSRFTDVYGASIKGMSIGKGGRAVVSGNVINNTLRGVNLTDFDDIVIDANQISDVFYGNAYGITVARDEAADSSPRRVVISDNNVSRCVGRGISVSSALMAVMTGNSVVDCGGDLVNMRACQEIIVSGNEFIFRDLSNLVSTGVNEPWEHNAPYAAESSLTVNALMIAEGPSAPSKIILGTNLFSNVTAATTTALKTDATTGEIRVPRDIADHIFGFTTEIEDPNSVVKGRVLSGTFTPEFAPATGAFETITYDSFRSGSYTVSPDGICHFSLSLRTDAVTVGTASGAIFVTGLPFAAPSTSTLGEAANQPVFLTSSDWTACPVEAYVVASSTTIALRKRTTSTGAGTSIGFSDMTNAANSNTVRISGSYRISPSISV